MREAEVLDGFLPPVAAWFREAFEAPSPAQTAAWPVIRRGDNTLLLAPTGSGKTLAAFLCAIDDLYRRAAEGCLEDGVHVLYITPLKALGNDIQKNLLLPLAGIRGASGDTLPELRAGVRTGDTTQQERERMVRQPPHILITTPESLYLLLMNARMAGALRCIRTVIVDEVHALCDNKRGAHLVVSLERLADHVGHDVQRIGCSATLSPIETIAHYLVGNDASGRQRPCTLVDAGMRKDLDVQAQAPLADFLEAGHTALWSSAYDMLLREIGRHRTTLIFTNSRYKAERTALRMRELAGDSVRIGVHHGSMSKETRLEAEDDLKCGRLDALIATSSLELGIDVGSVDLVCQLESPKSIATGLQRVGRAGHLLSRTSKGRVLLFEREELLEAAAICRAMARGSMDAIHVPRGCLDVLAQQVVGAAAARDWRVDDLFALARRSYTYGELDRHTFERVLAMLAGEHPFQMAMPPKPLILWDRAAGRISAARQAAHVAAMCVGTIGESAEYEVVIAASNKRVGAVQSEFVDDSLRIGDVFTLGSSSWRVAGIRRNRVLVEEAPGATPTVPWWLGPVASRTIEVGEAVGLLRRGIAARLDDPDLNAWLQREYLMCPDAAEAVAEFLREQRAAAGFVPDHGRLLVETWRDELGRTNVILHSPYGQRINRTWGLAISAAARRRWRQEWTPTATNDLLLLTRSESADSGDPPVSARELVAAAEADGLSDLLVAQARDGVSFGSAFRDVAVCSFQILRAWQGKRMPLWLQNHRAQELFEAAGTCRDYPVVAEVLREHQEDTLDIRGLAGLLGRVAAGEVAIEYSEVESPSPFAHALLVLDRYSDDHQMGRDRRAHLLRLHRKILQEVLSAEQMAQLLDPRAIERLERKLARRSEETRARNADELAQAIRELGDVSPDVAELAAIVEGDAAAMLAELVRARRVLAVRLRDVEGERTRLVAPDLWRLYHDAFELGSGGDSGPASLRPRLAKGRIAGYEAIDPLEAIPAEWRQPLPRDEARRHVADRLLRTRGPVTVYEIANHTGWPVAAVEEALDGLVEAGTAARGVYTADKPQPQWVNRANLEEIHRLTLGYLKQELAACRPPEVVDFLLRWQHVHPDHRLRGLEGVREAVRQLQGYEMYQGVLETEILPARVIDYEPAMLDRLVAGGEVGWGRVCPDRLKRGMIALYLRADRAWLASGRPIEIDAEAEADCDIAPAIKTVREHFRAHRSAFFDEILAATGVEEGAALRAVWHLVWCGELTCDTYECIRHADFVTTLSACYDLDSTPRKIVQGRMSAERPLKQMRRRRMDARLGRWHATERLAPPDGPLAADEVARRWAAQLLARWGIVTRELVASEAAAPAWTDVARELKRMEMLGQVTRGYFIDSHGGEQYGLPEAIELLRDCRARRAEGGLGYLPDEPLLRVTNKEPANLYAACLEVLDARGEVFQQSRRTGNLHVTTVMQAGQPLLYASWQLVPLDRRQLTRCIETARVRPDGHAAETRFRDWCGRAFADTTAGGLLCDLGFRLDAQNDMFWPAPRTGRPVVSTYAECFPPHYALPDPVAHGPDVVVRDAAPALAPVVEAVVRVVQDETARRGWTMKWHRQVSTGAYRGVTRMWVRAARTFIEIGVRVHRRTDDGWDGFHRRFRFAALGHVTAAFPGELAGALAEVEAFVERHGLPGK